MAFANDFLTKPAKFSANAVTVDLMKKTDAGLRKQYTHSQANK